MTNGTPAKTRILIVDDIPDTVQLLKDWLEDYNFSTVGVTNSVQALEVAEQEKPDLILLDVMMPRMDGMETCRRLKANPQTSDIPVILVTAKNPSDARAEGIMAGAIDYITKPINLPDLIKRIEIALAANTQVPVDVERLLEEVAHSTLTILSCEMVWLLGIDAEQQVLTSRIVATSRGARAETDFLTTAGDGNPTPRYSLNDRDNPFARTLMTRQTVVNIATESLKNNPSTVGLHRAAELLRLNYFTCLPLTAAGKTVGVMALGGVQPHNMESPRATQILTSLASQAAIALDYTRVITNLTVRETEMRQEQTFRQMILDTMSDGLVVIDGTGTIVFVNRRLLRMTGYAKGFLEGRLVGELFHPDDRTQIMEGLLREGATTMRFDQRLLTRDNRIIPVWLIRSRTQTEDINNQVIVLSDMTEQKEREEELERQTGRLEALNRAAHTIASHLSLHETLKNILHSAMEVVEAQGASLFLNNKENPDELVVLAAVGTGAETMYGMRVPIGKGVAGWVAREAKSQLVTNIENDPRFYRDVDQKTGMSTQSLIAVPLITAENVVGVIEVVNKQNNRLFTQDDVSLLESMAGTAAVSIVNARLFDETQRRVNELATLLNASAAASSTLQFSQVLESIARNLAEGLSVARCTIMAWNAPKSRLESLAEICDNEWTAEDAPRRPLTDDPINERVIKGAVPILASLHDNDVSPESRADLASNGMISMMAVPLRIGDAVGGSATLYSLDTRTSFTESNIESVQSIFQNWLHEQGEARPLAESDSMALTSLAERLMEVGRTHWVTIRSWNAGDDFTRVLREKGFAEWTRRPGVVLPLEKYPAMQAVIRDQQVRTIRIANETEDPAETERLIRHGGRSCLLVPLLERGVAVGLVQLIDEEDRTFEESEIRLAQGIANVVSSAMENARLYQSLDSRARALESAYKELQEADKAKDEFIQNVSHELRTPLISVMGYGGLLVEEEFGSINDQQREALNTVMQKAQKLADIVQDIVSVQALETRTYDRKPVDLMELVRAALDKHADRAAEAGLRFNTFFPDSLAPIMADSKTISDAFEKILDNAIKFGSTGECIDITLQDTDTAVVQVTVRDYGIGIDPSEHHKIFQRFYQVDGGTDRRYPGTGIGLAIAKSIIEGHGGRIGVKSKPNEGASFVFTLPKYEPLAQK